MSDLPDLVELAGGPKLTREQRRRLFKKCSTPVPRGHARPPGSGPKGETCGTCEHIVRRRLGKAYLKCGLAKHKWTGGRASDIRSGDPACEWWAARSAEGKAA